MGCFYPFCQSISEYEMWTLESRLVCPKVKFDGLVWNPSIALALLPRVENSSKYISHFFCTQCWGSIHFFHLQSHLKLLKALLGEKTFAFSWAGTYISFAWYYSSYNRSWIHYNDTIQRDQMSYHICLWNFSEYANCVEKKPCMIYHEGLSFIWIWVPSSPYLR